MGMLSHPPHVRSRGQKAKTTATDAVAAVAGNGGQSDGEHPRSREVAPETADDRKQIIDMAPEQAITSEVVGARLRRTGP